MPAFPELDRPLSDGRVALRYAEERDIPEILIAHQDDPEMYARLGLERPPSAAELGRQMEEAPGERASGLMARLTILEGPSDECRGRILVHEVDWSHARAELGVWVTPRARGRGLASAAIALAARWLLDDRGFARVQVLTEADNKPMLDAARSAGFVEEGVLRSYSVGRRSRHDMVALSLLQSDLERAR
jgi:RimJ/RimL family protein N-acetyltransferase